MEKQEYLKKVEQSAAHSHVLRDCLRSFIVGGAICLLGQCVYTLFENAENDERISTCLVSVTLIFLACLFTGIGWFDSLAKFAGAGTLVPITGFANAIASPAIDCKNEGLVLGLGAKMFIIAGPVIVYGVVASSLYGFIYWICSIV